MVNKLYSAGVFSDILRPKVELTGKNIIKGSNVHIEPSAVLITHKKGWIIFRGDNRIGKNTELQPSLNGSIKIGKGTSIQDRNMILGDVEFGRYCLTAPNVYLSSGRHYFDMFPYLYIKDQDTLVHSSEELASKHSKKIIIEDDVWIGINSVIMSGVKIGRGSIIGSNSVVIKDVPPFTIMAGTPAKPIKKRINFAPKQYIQFDIDEDLPNFYKGFLLNRANLKDDRKEGGLAATKKFTLYLDKTGNKIEVTLKKIINERVTIQYNQQNYALENSEYTTFVFQSSHQEFHEFFIDGLEVDEDQKILLIKTARTIN